MNLHKILKPKLSVVVPAHNEEEYIGSCIEALLNQTVRPHEIIIVDNNSTDKTAEIARRYEDIVVIEEKKQGIFYARNAGFNAASGDIIVRTDADSLVSPNWLQSVVDHYENNNPAAVTGSLTFSDVYGLRWLTRAESLVRSRLIRSVTLPKFLSGANMSIRRDVWLDIWQTTCPGSHLHEDVDLTIHLQKAGYEVSFEPGMTVSTSARRMSTDFLEYYSYVKKIESTYNFHGKSGLIIKIPVLLYVPFQPLIKVARKLYYMKRYKTKFIRLASELLNA